MPVGTAGSAYCAPGCTSGTGTSTLTLPNFYDWNTHSYRSLDLSSPEGLTYIRNALRAWGAAAGVTFVQVTADTGVPINDPAAEPPGTGQIRIGVFEMGYGAPAGAGFAAPPNGFIPNSSQLATGAGDLILNSTYHFQNPAGAEGAPLDSFPLGGGYFLNDLEGLILHEIGHTLGLDHSADATAVMCGWPYSCTYGNVTTYVINRQPEPDDVAGLRVLYGLPLDTDADTVPDAVDNCSLKSNADQFDGDGDGYGNRCDGDLNNNGSTNAQDTVLFRARLGTADAAADINHNGSVNAQDTTLFRQLLGAPPGPSGLKP
ncbi:MAG: matrixin family metalloprotease [Gammaproteobacteria bacterium]|nr:matrixin family metalloprotease [Gammaproteobacteria bacterium]